MIIRALGADWEPLTLGVSTEARSPSPPEAGEWGLSLRAEGWSRYGPQNSRLLWKAQFGRLWKVLLWGLGSRLIHSELLSQGGHLEPK